MKKFSISVFILIALLFPLLLMGCATAPLPPAPTCEYPVAQERASWVRSGLEVVELDAKAVTDTIRLRLGEQVDADQVFFLRHRKAPNVMLVFAKDGCIFGKAVFTPDQFVNLFSGQTA